MTYLKCSFLTFLLVTEFFIVASFSIYPIEHGFLCWLITILLFEAYDLLEEEYRKKTPSSN